MSTIRLTITPEMEEVLSELEAYYKPMTRVGILKLGIAKLLQNIKQARS